MNREARKAKRICHISTVHRPDDVRIFLRECNSLVQDGYEVHLVIGAPRAEVKARVHIHPMRLPQHRLLRMLLGPWIAMRTALRTRSWVYHYHDPELIGMGFVLRWCLGKKVIFDIHECVWRQLESKPYLSTWMGRPLGWAYRCLERGLTIGQVKVVANAHSEGDYNNATLVQNFPHRLPEVIPAHRTFDFANPPQLVYLGNLSAIRGAHAYVDLAHQLKLRNRSFRMVLMGEHTESFHRELKDKIRTLGLESQVEITGRVAWVDAMQIVSKATIGLCLLQPVPNYTTCLATKILEYMMVGTPVLASHFDCWRRFVEDEGVGLMVDPLDGSAVLEACECLLDNEASLAEMSRRGQQAIQERYHWGREFKKLQACYEQLFL